MATMSERIDLLRAMGWKFDVTAQRLLPFFGPSYHLRVKAKKRGRATMTLMEYDGSASDAKSCLDVIGLFPAEQPELP